MTVTSTTMNQPSSHFIVVGDPAPCAIVNRNGNRYGYCAIAQAHTSAPTPTAATTRRPRAMPRHAITKAAPSANTPSTISGILRLVSRLNMDRSCTRNAIATATPHRSAARPASNARMRKYSRSSGTPRRAHSTTRYEADTNAPTATVNSPAVMDTALTHALVGLPTPFGGTRPDMIAPTLTPKKNGVITAPMPNNQLDHCRAPVRAASLRSAKFAPRRTMPSAASASGTNSAVMMAPNAPPNAVQVTTRM